MKDRTSSSAKRPLEPFPRKSISTQKRQRLSGQRSLFRNSHITSTAFRRSTTSASNIEIIVLDGSDEDDSSCVPAKCATSSLERGSAESAVDPISSTDTRPAVEHDDSIFSGGDTEHPDKQKEAPDRDWPWKGKGVAEGICDWDTLQDFMLSDKINNDHKAMFISLVQMLAFAPSPFKRLEALKQMVIGDTILLREGEQPSDAQSPDAKHFPEKMTWAVTASMRGGQQKWTAAHVVAAALESGGPSGAVQAAKALRVFGIWSPTANYIVHEHNKYTASIKKALTRDAVLAAIYPSGPNVFKKQEQLLEWARQSGFRRKFSRIKNWKFYQDLEIARTYLQKKCIGEDLSQFSKALEINLPYARIDSMITKPYFDNVLSLILKNHFDPHVDLASLWEAVCRNDSVERNNVERIQYSKALPKRIDSNGSKGYKDGSSQGKGATSAKDSANDTDDEESDQFLTVDVKEENTSENSTRSLLGIKTEPGAHSGESLKSHGPWTSQLSTPTGSARGALQHAATGGFTPRSDWGSGVQLPVSQYQKFPLNHNSRRNAPVSSSMDQAEFKRLMNGYKFNKLHRLSYNIPLHRIEHFKDNWNPNLRDDWSRVATPRMAEETSGADSLDGVVRCASPDFDQMGLSATQTRYVYDVQREIRNDMSQLEKSRSPFD